VGDVCANSACAPGKKVNCDDNNPCTDDGCDLAQGCTATANSAPCNDGNACTAADTCGKGVCLGSAATPCDDGNACTIDWCDPSKGCQGLAVGGPCDDGSACTGNDVCTKGKCGGVAITCDDGNPCTADACNAQSGCTAPAVADGQACGGNGVCKAGVCSLGSQANPASSCLAILKAIPASASGVYWLDPNKTGGFEAYCDMVTEGGGWTSLVHMSPIAKLNFTVPHSEVALSADKSFWKLGKVATGSYATIAYNGRPSAAIEATAAAPSGTGWAWMGVAWPNPAGCHVVQQLILTQAPTEAPRSYGNPSYNSGQAMPAAVLQAAKPTLSTLSVAKVANYPAIHVGCVGWNVLTDPVIWVR
jgi:hypothetical protein